MTRLRLNIDPETFTRLHRLALAEKRPIDWQAEVILRLAVGLPFPPDGTPKVGSGDPLLAWLWDRLLALGATNTGDEGASPTPSPPAPPASPAPPATR